jgi:hypothetical protein
MALTTPFTPSQLNLNNSIKFAKLTNDKVVISPLGDLNNDRLDDYIVKYDINGAVFRGNSGGYIVYVVYGAPRQTAASLELKNLVAPTSANRLSGGLGEVIYDSRTDRVPGSGSFFENGFGELRMIDDINGDGLEEVLIRDSREKNIVIFGKANGLKSSDLLSTTANLDGSNGFRIPSFGYSGKVVGDVNGDQINDFATESGIFFGRRNGFPVELVTPDVITKGLYFLSKSVEGVGDLNGDGRADLIARDENENQYILLSPANFPTKVDFNQFPAELGVKIAIDGDKRTFSSSLTAIGDINKDGFGDLFLESNTYAESGKNRIIYGGTNLPSNFTFSDSRAVLGTTVIQNDRNVINGVRALGDINGDKIDDLIIDFYFSPGTFNSDDDSYSKVIFGRVGGFGDRLRIISEISNGFIVYNSSKNIGDFNGDGINDLYTGDSSSSKITFGGRQIVGLSDAQIDGKNGVVLATNLVPIGDINGDGRVDLAKDNFIIYGTNFIRRESVYNFPFGGRAYNHNEFPDGNSTNADRLNYSSTATAPTWVYGGTANDTLAGHSGYIDQLTGGDGADTFVFNLEFGQQKGNGFGVVWDFVPGVDKVQVYGTANDYFFVEDSSTWLDNPSFLKKTIDTSATVNTILARRDADLGAVMIGAFSDVRLSISDLTFVPNTSV